MVIRHDLLPRSVGPGPGAAQPIWEEECWVATHRATHDDRTRCWGTHKHTCYRIKPYGQLVSVSLTHYCASTPDLSTSWSRTTLQGARSPGDISSQGEFPA